MTPPATTAAGRGATRAPAGRGAAGAPAGPAASPPGHRRRPRSRPAPLAPRRVSGPLVGAPRPSATPPRRSPAPRHGVSLGTRALAVVRSLPEHSLIDRLVRGRAWIPVVGVLLVGIVAMQVEVLKLGTTEGKLVQRSGALQSQNESLQASVASLGDDQRIERLAAGMGMVMPTPTTITFLRAGRDPGRALANLHAPDPATFASALAAQAAAAAAASAPASAPQSSPTGAAAIAPTSSPSTSSPPGG